MWIRTAKGLEFVEVDLTNQGLTDFVIKPVYVSERKIKVKKYIISKFTPKNF